MPEEKNTLGAPTLTGADLFHAFRMYDLDAAKQVDVSAYGVVAAILNTSHMRPLQNQIALLAERIIKLSEDIKSLRDTDHAIFKDQDKEIATLKALARDYQHILASLPDVSVWGCDYPTFANWQQQREKLEVRAQELLREEK